LHPLLIVLQEYTTAIFFVVVYSALRFYLLLSVGQGGTIRQVPWSFFRPCCLLRWVPRLYPSTSWLGCDSLHILDHPSLLFLNYTCPTVSLPFMMLRAPQPLPKVSLRGGMCFRECSVNRRRRCARVEDIYPPTGNFVPPEILPSFLRSSLKSPGRLYTRSIIGLSLCIFSIGWFSTPILCQSISPLPI